MAQTSIHCINKTGYSMFWDSMWDSKINYNLYSKQNNFLKKFINLFFNDCLSVNLFKYNKIKTNKFTKIFSKKEFFNYSLRNKTILYSTKLWILKYQNWLVIYNYFYISKFKKINNLNYNYKNFLYLYIKYNKAIFKNFSVYNKSFKLKF